MSSPIADMWSASITMMHGFHGRVDKDDEALEMVRLYFDYKYDRSVDYTVCIHR